MSYADKGKAPASSKRGSDDNEEDALGSHKKRRSSIHIDSSDCLPSDVKHEELDGEVRAINRAACRLNTLIVPKEEQIDEKEFERIIEERFQRHFGRLSSEEAPKSIGECSFQRPSTSDPKIWKVKCSVGRERKLVVCLMQKYVYCTYIRQDLQIISAFTVDRVKGFIFIEADKECYAYEACKSFDGLYFSKLEELSRKEVSLLLSTPRQEPCSLREGMSVRVTNGSYKGDVGEVWNVNKKRTHAVVKLVPRIDLKELAQKFGGEKTPLKLVTPAPKLISSLELAEFGSLVKEHINRTTGERFQVLDGLMLQDGYLFKKMPLDSLSNLSLSPPRQGLCKSDSSDKQSWAEKESANELFPISIDDEESETPKCKPESKFEFGELVFWGRNNFGLVINIEVDNTYKILKDEPEGHIVITIEESFLKHGPSCAKFSAFDMLKKGVFMDDRVRVSEGIFKDREGVVKKLYKGTLFIYDEFESENSGYFCCKALLCEKLNSYHNDLSLPNPPGSQSESTKTPHRSRENSNSKFFVGQRLRIKVGALKGHLCSFVKKHQSDVTVRLDTKKKTVQVKLEHLCEVHEKDSGLPSREVEHRNPETNDLEWNTEAKELNTDNPSWDAPTSNKDTETGWNEGMQVDHNSSWNDGSPKNNENGWSSQANPSWEAPSSSCKTSEAGGHETTPVDHNSAWNDEISKKKDSGWSTETNISWNAPSSSCQNSERGWNEGTQVDHKSSWNQQNSNKNDCGLSTETNKSWSAPTSSCQNSARGWNEGTLNDHKLPWNQENSKKNDSGWSRETNKLWIAPSLPCQNSERGWDEGTEVDHKSSWNQETSKKSDNGWNTETKAWNASSSSWKNSNNEATQVDHNSSSNDDKCKENDSGWCTETNKAWNAPSLSCQNSERGWNEGTRVDQTSWNQEKSKNSDNGWISETNTSWNAPSFSCQNRKNEATQADHNSSWNDESSKKNDNQWNAKPNRYGNAPRPSWKNRETGGHEVSQFDQSKCNLSLNDKNSKNINSGLGVTHCNQSLHGQASPWDTQVENNDQTNGWGCKGNLAGNHIPEQYGGWGKAPNTDDSTKESGWKRWRNAVEVAGTSSKVDSNVSNLNAPNSAPDNQGLSSWRSGSSGQSNAPTDSEGKKILSSKVSSWDAEVTVENDGTVGWGKRKESSFGAETPTNNDDSGWRNKGKPQGNWGSGEKDGCTDNNTGWNSNVRRGSFKRNFNDNNGGNRSWGRGQKGSSYGENSRNYNKWKADGSEKQPIWNKGETVNRPSWGRQENNKEWAKNGRIGSSSSWGKQEGSERGEGSSKNTDGDSVWDKAADEWGK